MYNKDIDFYTPLFVSNFCGEVYYYINKKIKLSPSQLSDYRDIWKEDDEFDGSFNR